MEQAKKILFLCTDNVGRSVIAEYCLRDHLRRNNIANIEVASAGTKADSDTSSFSFAHMGEMQKLGIDASEHQRTQVSQEIVDSSDLIISMDLSHQDWLKQNFGIESPLFNELYSRESSPIIVHEPGDGQNLDERMTAITHYIYDATPKLANNIINTELKPEENVENLEFRKLTADDEQAFWAFIGEFRAAQEKIIPSPVEPGNCSFLEWLETSEKTEQGIDLPEGYVPASSYFLVRPDNGKILGALNIRHKLNDFLLRKGGNIGYGVVPSERRKGYATLMLMNSLEKCRQLGMDKALVTCDKENIGSAKTIQKNGGVLENEVPEEAGNIICRYWIKIK